MNIRFLYAHVFICSGGSRGGTQRAQASPLIWVKKEKMTERRKAGWVSKIKPDPLLSSKSGSATSLFGSLSSLF